MSRAEHDDGIQVLDEFQDLSRYAISILTTAEERTYYFVQRLRPPLRIRTHSLVSLGRSYLDIMDHARSIEQFSCEALGDNNKCTRHEGGFSGSQSRFKGQINRSW